MWSNLMKLSMMEFQIIHFLQTDEISRLDSIDRLLTGISRGRRDLFYRSSLSKPYRMGD